MAAMTIPAGYDGTVEAGGVTFYYKDWANGQRRMVAIRDDSTFIVTVLPDRPMVLTIERPDGFETTTVHSLEDAATYVTGA